MSAHLLTIGDMRRALARYPDETKILFASPHEEDDFTDFVATLYLTESIELDHRGRPMDVMIHLAELGADAPLSWPKRGRRWNPN